MLAISRGDLPVDSSSLPAEVVVKAILAECWKRAPESRPSMSWGLQQLRAHALEGLNRDPHGPKELLPYVHHIADPNPRTFGEPLQCMNRDSLTDTTTVLVPSGEESVILNTPDSRTIEPATPQSAIAGRPLQSSVAKIAAASRHDFSPPGLGPTSGDPEGDVLEDYSPRLASVGGARSPSPRAETSDLSEAIL